MFTSRRSRIERYARRSRNDLRLPRRETQKGENHGGGTIGEIVLSLCRALFRPRIHALREKSCRYWIGRKDGTWERSCPWLSSRGRRVIECRNFWWQPNLWPGSRYRFSQYVASFRHTSLSEVRPINPAFFYKFLLILIPGHMVNFLNFCIFYFMEWSACLLRGLCRVL